MQKKIIMLLVYAKTENKRKKSGNKAPFAMLPLLRIHRDTHDIRPVTMYLDVNHVTS